jgi:uncharacterized protein YjiS (DUF1127 family)
MLNFIATWRRERETIRELSRLSDRELDDLGIGRGEIRAVAAGAPIQGAETRNGPASVVATWADQGRPKLAA